MEFKNLSIDALADKRASELEIYGVHIGMTVEEMRLKILGAQMTARIFADMWGVSGKDPTGQETDAGVDMMEQKGKIVAIRISPRASDSVNDEQVEYVASMSTTLRRFFEAYTDSERIRIFGKPDAIKPFDNGIYRETSYVYVDRGFRLVTQAWRKDNAPAGPWGADEIKEFILFQPGTPPPFGN